MIKLWHQFTASSTGLKLAIAAVVAIWVIAVVAAIAGITLIWERRSEAQLPLPGTSIPAITLEPASGPAKTSVTIHGQGWTPGRAVLIHMAAPAESGIPSYAIASVVADPAGQFVVTVSIPADSRWETTGLVTIIAKESGGEAAAQAFFSLVSPPGQPTETTVSPVEATPTPTPTPLVETPTPTPSPTSEPGLPLVTATTNVNIRSGPGTAYPVLGLLQTGQTAEITGLSPDGNWWQIRFAGATAGRGWLAARYVTAHNTGNVPIVQPPALPPPTPPVISDWRGEYYNNLNLSGAPVLVRNDASINFDWGNDAPAAGISADNFSVRWSRSLSFPAGTYRFYARVDDAVRLWVDNNLIIDQWHDSAPTTYTADMTLTDGPHQLKMEYYERSGTALAQLTWEWLEAYPDWKGEYFDNPNLSGLPVLVRNDLEVNFNWGASAPASGVPADNFSVRWTRNQHFSAGVYRFKVVVDDGARLWVDGNLVIDQWRSGPPRTFTADVTLTGGTHNLRLEYFDFIYDGQVRLDWQRLDNFPDWRAEYFDNRKLQGNPILIRNETRIEHQWGSGSPAAGVPADNFSARWTRQIDFKAGTYLFRIKVDDGARLWLDDELMIDSWQDGSTRTLEAERRVSEGRHRLKLEYYEHGGEARIELSWERQAGPANQPPQPDPGQAYTVNEGGPVRFDGSGSKDPDGKIVKYEWDFNYNGSAFNVDATGPNPTTRYPDGPATIIVALRVTDDRGASRLATTRVTVENVAPTADAGGPYTGVAGSPIEMAGSATDPGKIDQPGLTYRWDFGDGTTGKGLFASHIYAQPGTYTAKLTVKDKDGGRGSDTATVEVIAVNQPPQAVIKGPKNGQVGDSLNWRGDRSSDPDGEIVKYHWNFGDGSTASEANVTHTYDKAGRYTVTLTVTDNAGLTARAKHTIQID